MKAQATVRLFFSSEKQLQVILQALKPEIETSSTYRSKVIMTAKGQGLVLDFIARDTSALRASINSYLRLIGVAMDIQKFTNQ
jgi:KEOPS complex subunit Pcc1